MNTSWLMTSNVRAIERMLSAAESAKILPEMIEPAREYLRESQRLLKSGNAEAAAWAIRAAWERANFLRAGAEEKTEIRAGRKSVGGARAANDAKRGDASKQHDEWQRRANAIWKRHPAKSASDVAGMIADKYGGKPNTIRRRIKKLS